VENKKRHRGTRLTEQKTLRLTMQCQGSVYGKNVKKKGKTTQKKSDTFEVWRRSARGTSARGGGVEDNTEQLGGQLNRPPGDQVYRGEGTKGGDEEGPNRRPAQRRESGRSKADKNLIYKENGGGGRRGKRKSEKTSYQLGSGNYGYSQRWN